MLDIKEIHYYTSLVDKGLAPKINCPFEENNNSHFVVCKVDEDTNPFFKCLDCKSEFSLGLNSEEKIRNILDNYINQE